MDQHIGGEKHKYKKEKSRELLLPKKQQKLNFNRNHQQIPFYADLCDAFVSADIPLHKLGNPKLSSFLIKNKKEKMPGRATLQKNYISKIYANTLNKIREKVAENAIWISIDETTDVAHFLIGILGIEEEKRKNYLFNMADLETTNNSTIAKFVIVSLQVLWPEGIKYDCVLLATTDSAPYCINLAFKNLKSLFPKFIQVTCLAHGLHRIAEKVQATYTDVNMLISSCKECFLKAPKRKQIFKAMAVSTPLPPSPIVTRWGEWLNAEVYYADNIKLIATVVNSFNAEDAQSIENCQDILKSTALKRHFLFIKTNLHFISVAINKLQDSSLDLKEGLKIIADVETNWPANKIRRVKIKYLKKNVITSSTKIPVIKL